MQGRTIATMHHHNHDAAQLHHNFLVPAKATAVDVEQPVAARINTR